MAEQKVQGDRAAERLLREENEALRATLAELRTRLKEPEEILHAIRFGEVDAFVVTGTEGERVYSLKTTDLLYRVMIEDMKQGAVALDASGLIVYCNVHFATLMKASREAIIGTSLRPFVAAESRPSFDALLRKAPGGNSRGELVLRANDGQTVAVYVAANLISLEEHEVFCLVITDLTDQKRQERLVDEIHRKDEFLAMLAHELRNPLAPIRNALHVLRLKGPPDPELDWAKGVIDRQVQQMTRLVDDLLDISRITSGKINLQREPVELSTIIARGVETSRPAIDARRHDLSITVPPGPLRLQADGVRLAQVFSNLLNNAAKFTPEGGNIHLEVERHGGEVVVRVRDTGAGIAKAMLPKVFDLFTQVDGTVDRSESGLGLGLALVRSLVEMHGGSVLAASDGLGKGSEFSVRLPLLKGSAPSDGQRGKPAAPSPASRRCRVLVVDDNQDSAESIGVLLKCWGHDVRTALDGPKALEMARSHRPEAVLLDIGLPGMDGCEVARQLRKVSGMDKAVLLAMTGFGQEETRRRCREAGFDHHLVKPVDPEALQSLLGSLV